MIILIFEELEVLFNTVNKGKSTSCIIAKVLAKCLYKQKSVIGNLDI